MRALLSRATGDPRHFQIAVLAGLLFYGMGWLDFDISAPRALLVLGVALAAQWICGRLAGVARFEPRSALISGLSLCLLLRTNSPALAALAAVVAVGSKFALRVGGKHLFNPTNGALVLLLAAGAPVWVSPAQWGNAATLAFLVACLGGLVVHRALRSDVALAFAAAWGAVLFGRALWLGQPMAIPLHMLASGSLILFTFFMISDPRTTPDSRAGRILFGVLVALGAGLVQFVLYRTNGLLWSLAVVSLATPLLDRVLPGDRYEWNRARRQPSLAAAGTAPVLEVA